MKVSMMKKLSCLVLAVGLSVSVTACGGSTAGAGSAAGTGAPGDSASSSEKTETAVSAETKEAAENKVAVDDSLLTVDVTLGSAFFEDSTPEEIQAAAKENGFLKCRINDDGSVTYTMTKAKRKEFLNEYEKSIEENLKAFIEGDQAVASFQEIRHNGDFSEFNVYMDPEKATMWDTFYCIPLYLSGAYYQVFAGKDPDQLDVIVNFIDVNTKETVQSGSYRAWVENAEAESAEKTEAENKRSAAEENAAPLSAGELVSKEDYELTLESVLITGDVMPPKPASFYQHYEADQGKKFVDICFAYKNLAASAVGADEILTGNLLYCGRYKYRGSTAIEEKNRGSFGYANITSIDPLATEYLHYLFEIPDSAAESDGSLAATIFVNDDAYVVPVREGDPSYKEQPEGKAILKDSGVIKAGDVIAIPDVCEFEIESVNITDDVMPPKPADFYNHYEAEDGKTYVDLCVAYKNWKDSDVGADDVISGRLFYAEKYEYSGSVTIEEKSRGSFGYANITSIAPLMKEYLHLLFEVPDEVAGSSEALSVNLTVSGKDYSYKVR